MKAPSFAPAYVAFFPRLAEIAQAKGYALAIHGSVQRDLDLVAIPWTADAEPDQDLIQAIADYASGVMTHMFGAMTVVHGPELKPHGRKAWSIIIGNGAVIDLSILPRIASEFN